MISTAILRQSLNSALQQHQTGGIYNPSGKVTRAQLAAFVYRANEFDLNREKGTIYYDEARRMYVDKTKPEPMPPVTDVPAEAEATINIVNKHRALGKASALSHDLELSLIAQAKAEDMVNKNYFDHHSPTYGTVGSALKHFNYRWSESVKTLQKTAHHGCCRHCMDEFTGT